MAMKKDVSLVSILSKIINSPVGITFIVFAILSAITISLSWSFYNKSFYENVLSNVNGSLIDLFIIGIVLLWLNNRRESKYQITRWIEEIDDFRYWKEPEATFRIAGNIKRLNSVRISEINLFRCNLEKAFLQKVNLKKAWLFGTIFKNANLISANLSETTCMMTDFTNSILYKVNFSNADLSGTIFLNSDLSYADFTGAKGLSAAQLSQSQSLWNAKFDDGFLETIKSTCLKQLNAVSCRCSDESWPE
jgi:BTB/POZ domain-containing protein KCTD9